MKSLFTTPLETFCLSTDKFICNKFGLAEFFAEHYEQLEIKAKGPVLDVGCGAGPLGIFLAKEYDLPVTGVEINPTAFQCCQNNIKAFSLSDKFNVLNMNFDSFESANPCIKFNIIVSNPPIDDTISDETVKKYADDDFKHLDPESFSYVTNSWHHIDGTDLVDLIFMYARDHLENSGSVVIVFCLIDCHSPEVVLNKAVRYGFIARQIIHGKITPESIGADSFLSENITTYMISFQRKDSYEHKNNKCL